MISKLKYLVIITIGATFCSAMSQESYIPLIDSPKVCFLRHGRTSWTWEMLAKGPRDLPLTKEGVQNVKKAGMVKGMDSKASEIAKSMLKKGYSADVVEELTGLGREAIEKLKQS